MASEKDRKVYNAKLAEQAERYDEMAACMKIASETDEELTVEERNLLSVAYKNSVGARRASWRIISSIEKRERGKGNGEHASAAENYRVKVEAELKKICNEALGLLIAYLIPGSQSGEAKVFYYKMKGDYHRYLAEFSETDIKKTCANDAREAYESAMSIAQSELLVTHPIRLGLALNFSVFYYEVLNNAEEACKMARTAFEDAIAELDSASEDSYKDSTLIMQLLRDNLTLWTSDQDGDGEQP